MKAALLPLALLAAPAGPAGPAPAPVAAAAPAASAPTDDRAAMPGVARRPFGLTADGTPVEAITLSAGRTSATVLTLGAILQAVRVPGRDGQVADVALGYDDLAGYLADTSYFGASIGRVANRIAGGAFPLDGRTVHVPVNTPPNVLHGGDAGFNRVVWRVAAVAGGPSPSVTLAMTSPDGAGGFPGTLEVTATYRLDRTGALFLTYRATTDRPTIVNLTNHSYWNLAGEGAPGGACGERLRIPADRFTPVDRTLIPTGELRPVAGTPFDFRRATPVDARLRDGTDEQLRFGRGYDHNWAVATARAPEPRLVARLEDPGSGRVLEVLSTEPGVQFYSGNGLGATVRGKGGHLYRQGDGIALEPQMFPDTPNHPRFGSIRLAPGQVYEHRIVFRFPAPR